MGQLFSLMGDEGIGNVIILIYDTHTWQLTRNIKSPCACSYTFRHTLYISNENITLACCDTDTIYTMTYTGDIEHITEPRQFKWPHLCSTASDSILVAENGSNRLQLLHNDKWLRVQLKPKPMSPRDAVYVGGALFVLSNHVFQAAVTKYVST